MAKVACWVGYATTKETKPGVWEASFVERKMRGNTFTNLYSNIQPGDKVNDNFYINNRISVMGDPYMWENFQQIRYIKWLGATWKVTGVEPTRPRLILTLGGVWNGPTTETTNGS